MRGRSDHFPRWSVRIAAAFAAAIAGCVAAATAAAAASTIQLTQNLPTSPVHVTVGDVIVLTLPPVSAGAPPGYTGGPFRFPMPSTSDSDVLPQVSGTYDSDGTLHAQFDAAAAGTATISVSFPATVACKTTTTSNTSTSSTSTVTSTQSTTTDSTTVSTSTTSTSTTSLPPGEECIVGDPIAPRTVAVIVSAVGVEGATDPGAATGAVSVPSTGSNGSAAAGLAVSLVGALLAGSAVVQVKRGRRGHRQ